MRARILVLATIFALLAVVSASAGTNKFTIKLKREEISGTAGKVSFKVKTSKTGVATKLTSIKISGLKSICLSEDGTTPGATVTGKVKGSIKIKKFKINGKTQYSFQKSSLKVDGFFFSINGTINKKGTKVTYIDVNGSDADPNPPSCGATGTGKGKRK